MCFVDSHDVGGGLTWLGATFAGSTDDADDDTPANVNAREIERKATAAARVRTDTVWRPVAIRSLEALALVLLAIVYCRCVCGGQWGVGRKRTRAKVVVFCPQEDYLHGRVTIQTAKPLVPPAAAKAIAV